MTTHLSEDISHPGINLRIRSPIVDWPRVLVVRRRVVVFLGERPDSVELEDVVAGIMYGDIREEGLGVRGSVEKVSPTSAFCLFRVGRRVTPRRWVFVFFTDVVSTVVELFAARSDDDDVRMITVGVERVESSLIRTGVDDDCMVMGSSISMRFFSNFAPIEGGRCGLEEVGESFLGKVFCLGIRQEELLRVESRLSRSAGHFIGGTERLVIRFY